jgi:serine-type D-Ala-D-Ala carboxypeptidase (penicillin-binding protein 5/6)
MTAYLTFTALEQGRIRPHQQVPVSVGAWRTIGSRMFIEPRKPVTVKQLMNGMIVQSGNDASVALAEAIAGSEEAFVALMNREAQRLGLKNTRFANATGLPHPDHYSTTEDLAALAAAIIRDFPKYYPLYSQKDYSYNKIKQSNRNRLLWSDPTVDGVKTGHTENAGWCLITSAKRGEHRLISVVLGAPSESARAAESQKLINYGFRFFDSFRVHAKNEPVATLRVFKGAADTVKAGVLADLYVTLPKGQRSKLKAVVESMQPLLAPISVGQRVGTMKLQLDGKPYRELPVVALENVPVAGILGRSWDSIRLWFQ